ncbi:MAG: hypothetical protein ACR2ID_11025 [Chthoniobacterales bacterium]
MTLPPQAINRLAAMLAMSESGVRKTRDSPALALSGFGTVSDVNRAKEAGFQAHPTKPVNFQKLEAAIRQLTSA